LAHDEYTNSCLNTRAIIEYTRRRHPDRVGELFTGLPEPWATMPSLELHLSDENNWVPSTVVVKMFENVKTITGNPAVAFDIGFESIIQREFSYFQKLFLTFFSSPRAILRILNRLNTKLNTTKIIETAMIASRIMSSTMMPVKMRSSLLRMSWPDQTSFTPGMIVILRSIASRFLPVA
jgi:hypothetical protein